MTNIQQVKLMNETTILYLKKLGKSTKRNEIVNNILEDEACFFKLSKNDSYFILKDIGVSESKIDEVYSELISKSNYYDLQNRGIIKKNDEDIIIRYNENESVTFNNKKNTENMENTNIAVVNKKENFIKSIINKIKNFFNNHK